MLRAYTESIKPRIYERKKSKIKGVKGWDIDNLYPYHIENLINQSGTAKSATTLYKRFLKGNGFSQGDVLVNETQTLDQLYDLVLRDYTRFKGFSLHISYDLLGGIKEIKHVPFKYVRFTEDESQVVVYDNWDLSKKRKIEKENFLYFDFYEPKNALESLENGSKGQILYYSNDGYNTYPLSCVDAVVEDVLADYETKIFKLKNLQNGFMLKGIFVYPEQESQSEGVFDKEEGVRKELKKFQGSDGSQTMALEYSGDIENLPVKYLPVQSNSNDKAFEYTEKSVRKSIIKHFNQPATLHSDQEGGLFGKDQYLEAYEIYNNFTHDDRMSLQSQFNALFPMMGMNEDEIEVLNFRTYDTNTRETEGIQENN